MDENEAVYTMPVGTHLTRLHPQTLRKYERAGLLTPSRRSGNQQLYSEADISLRVIRDLLVHEPVGRGTDIAGALEYLRGMLRQKAIIFLVSDFFAPNLERPLKLAAQQHDVVAVTIEDPSTTWIDLAVRMPSTGEGSPWLQADLRVDDRRLGPDDWLRPLRALNGQLRTQWPQVPHERAGFT